MQPTATTALADPSVLRSDASSSVSTESFLAASTKPQVFTITVSASSGLSTSRKPPASSRPASSSESTSLRAQPSVTRATVVGVVVIAPEYDCWASRVERWCTAWGAKPGQGRPRDALRLWSEEDARHVSPVGWGVETDG